MKNLIFIVCLSIMSVATQAQNFNSVLLDDTTQTGIPDPTNPIIFHLEALNTTTAEFHVDVFRENVNVPEGWETALCTEACFPPEISEAIFFMDELATDEVSFYFYPSSEGVGNASIRLVNTFDSTNYFVYTFYVNTNPLGVGHSVVDQSMIYYDGSNKSIIIEGKNLTGQLCRIYGIDGRQVYENKATENFLQVSAEYWSEGTYIIKIDEFITSKIVVY